MSSPETDANSHENDQLFQLFLNREYEKALALFTNALEIKPGDKTALVARSKCYLHIGDPESALKVCHPPTYVTQPT